MEDAASVSDVADVGTFFKEDADSGHLGLDREVKNLGSVNIDCCFVSKANKRDFTESGFDILCGSSRHETRGETVCATAVEGRTSAEIEGIVTIPPMSLLIFANVSCMGFLTEGIQPRASIVRRGVESHRKSTRHLVPSVAMEFDGCPKANEDIG